jgi:hypothetical protein
MITNKEQSEINKFLSNHIFTMNSEFIGTGFEFEFDYKIKLVGTQKMISVGEYYDFIRVFVSIVDSEKRFKSFLKIMSTTQQGIRDKQFIEKLLFNDYRFKNDLDRDISENLKYFSDSKDYVRVKIEFIILTDNFYKEIVDSEITF